MANFDDIFNASQSAEKYEKSFSSFDKEEWAAQKKQERETAFAMIDETAEHMVNDGELFQSYLDVQAHFDRYSVGNAILITAQKPDATQLADSKSWKDNRVYIKRRCGRDHPPQTRRRVHQGGRLGRRELQFQESVRYQPDQRQEQGSRQCEA